MHNQFKTIIRHNSSDTDGLMMTLRAIDSARARLNSMNAFPALEITTQNPETLKRFVSRQNIAVGVKRVSETLNDLQSKPELFLFLIDSGDLPTPELVVQGFKELSGSEIRNKTVFRPKTEYHFFERDFDYHTELGKPHWSSRSHFKTFTGDAQELAVSRLPWALDVWSSAIFISSRLLVKISTNSDGSLRESVVGSLDLMPVLKRADVENRYIDSGLVAIRHRLLEC